MAPQVKLLTSDNVEVMVGMSSPKGCSLQQSLFESPRKLTVADRNVAERSVLIKNMLEDLGDASTSEVIPIPNVSCRDDNHPSNSILTWGIR